MKRVLMTAGLVSLGSLTVAAQEVTVREISVADGKRLVLTTAIDPKRADNYAVVTSDGNITTSTDGGKTWEESATGINQPAGSWLFSDKKGELYAFALNNGMFQASLSSDLGKSWKSLGEFALENLEGIPSLAFHPEKGEAFMTYVRNTDCTRELVFMQSKNGKKWSDPAVLNKGGLPCAEGELTPADLTIGGQGYIYALWLQNNKIYMDRSFDEGTLWLGRDVEFKTVRIGAEYGRPEIDSDRSLGMLRGSLYAVWLDETQDKIQILASRSSNQGDFWTPSVPVSTNDKSLFPALEIDQSNGITYVTYWSETGENNYDLYLAFSIDGAQTFKSLKINEAPVINTADNLRGAVSLSVIANRILLSWYSMKDSTAEIHTRVTTYGKISVSGSSD